MDKRLDGKHSKNNVVDLYLKHLRACFGRNRSTSRWTLNGRSSVYRTALSKASPAHFGCHVGKDEMILSDMLTLTFFRHWQLVLICVCNHHAFSVDGLNLCSDLTAAAHMVVIKGVHTFSNNASREYSDLDIMQMLGRAVCFFCSLVASMANRRVAGSPTIW